MKLTTFAITLGEIERAKQAFPRAFGRPLGERLRLGLLVAGFAALTGFALWRTGFFDLPRLAGGFIRLGDVLAFMLPPTPRDQLGDLIYALLETMAMAFLGTLMATLAAIPLGFLGARNVVRNRLVHFTLRRILDVIRGIDVLIWALIFVHVVGLGPFAGIMALTVSDTGTLAKLFAEALENVDTRPIDGVRAAGGNPLQVIGFGLLPQVFPVILSNALYQFESNTRSATILGIVGAGGIGLQLSDRIRINAWDEALFIVLLILIAVYGIDQLSGAIRAYFIGGRRARA